MPHAELGRLLRDIQGVHEECETVVRVDYEVATDWIKVRGGIRQGCPMF